MTLFSRLTTRSALLPINYKLHLPHAASTNLSNAQLCAAMRMTSRQHRMCLRHTGMGAVLYDVIRLSVQACQLAFQNERWNCTLSGNYRYNILKKGQKCCCFLTQNSEFNSIFHLPLLGPGKWHFRILYDISALISRRFRIFLQFPVIVKCALKTYLTQWKIQHCMYVGLIHKNILLFCLFYSGFAGIDPLSTWLSVLNAAHFATLHRPTTTKQFMQKDRSLPNIFSLREKYF